MLVLKQRTFYVPLAFWFSATLLGCQTMPLAPQTQNPEEKEILIQAQAVAAIAGCAGGVVIANNIRSGKRTSLGPSTSDLKKIVNGLPIPRELKNIPGMNDSLNVTSRSTMNKAVGCALGGVGGWLVGTAVGTEQIKNYRNVRMENDSLERMLQSARATNQDLASYNASLETEMRRLKTKNEIRTKREAAERRQKKAAESAKNRRVIANSLTPAQKQQYESTIADLEREQKELQRSIDKLRKMEGKAMI